MTRNAWVAVLIAALLISVPLTLLVFRQGETIKTVCRAERGVITRQQAQTQALLNHGYTFGIPKAQIPRLVQESKVSEERFLNDLNC